MLRYSSWCVTVACNKTFILLILFLTLHQPSAQPRHLTPVPHILYKNQNCVLIEAWTVSHKTTEHTEICRIVENRVYSSCDKCIYGWRGELHLSMLILLWQKYSVSQQSDMRLRVPSGRGDGALAKTSFPTQFRMPPPWFGTA